MLIDHMATGMSFLTFAALAKCSEEVLYEWTENYPDFLQAKKEAMVLNRSFWENKGVTGFGERYFNNVLWIFNMKNRFRGEWNDRSDSKVTLPFTAKEILREDDDK